MNEKIALKEIPVQILSLREGDVLLLRVPVSTSPEQCFRLRSEVSSALKVANHRAPVICVPDNVDLAVVKKALVDG